MNKHFLFSILLVLLLTACSNQEMAKEEKEELTVKAEEQVKEQETPKEKEESKFTYNPEEFNRELTEMEKMLMRQPGAFSGESIKTVVNIIGFDVDREGQTLLKEVAEAGNGTFTYVNSEQQMKDYLREQYEQLQQAWFEWKEAGKEQAFAIKEEKKKLAHDTKESMKEKVNQEKERMKKAQEYVKEKHKEDYDHPIRGTFSLIIDRHSEIFRYAVDTGNGLFREAVDNGNDQFREYVDEGNEKIRETTDKKKSE